jgi:hypothetical protein
MYSALKVLIAETWICPQDDRSDSDFVFNHPLLYDIIYDLTPSSDRISMHTHIAQYLETMHADDPEYFQELYHHFSFCNPTKAFEYAVKKSEYCLHEEDGDLETCCLVLDESVKFIKTLGDCRLVTAVLQRVRTKFVEVYGHREVISKPESADFGHRSVSLDSAGGRICPAESVPTNKMRSRKLSFSGRICVNANKWLFSCRKHRTSSRRKSGKPSWISEVSGQFSVQYTGKGVGLISRLLQRIEQRIFRVEQTLQNSLIHDLLPWQEQFLRHIDDEQSSVHSNSSWTYRAPNFRKQNV